MEKKYRVIDVMLGTREEMKKLKQELEELKSLTSITDKIKNFEFLAVPKNSYVLTKDKNGVYIRARIEPNYSTLEKRMPSSYNTLKKETGIILGDEDGYKFCYKQRKEYHNLVAHEEVDKRYKVRKDIYVSSENQIEFSKCYERIKSSDFIQKSHFMGSIDSKPDHIIFLPQKVTAFTSSIDDLLAGFNRATYDLSNDTIEITRDLYRACKPHLSVKKEKIIKLLNQEVDSDCLSEYQKSLIESSPLFGKIIELEDDEISLTDYNNMKVNASLELEEGKVLTLRKVK